MPELMDGAILIAIAVAGLSWIIANRPNEKRRLPMWGVVLVGVAAAYVGPPVFALVQNVWRSVPGLPHITGGAALFGLWVALVALLMFERKGQPRRVPIWAGIVLALVAAVAVPPLIDRVSGTYQRMSLRADVNGCARWAAGGSAGAAGTAAPVRLATNICDYPITVGLCLPHEQNPSPCAQSITLAPGAAAEFNPAGAALSALPSNPNGYTVVACRPPSRPSRTLTVMGRGHEGVCVPAK